MRIENDDLDRLRELLGVVASWEDIPEERECKRSGRRRNIVHLSTILMQIQDGPVSQDCYGYLRA